MATRTMAIAALLITLGASARAAEPVAGDPEKVKRVEAGRLVEARADWWGFDPKDSTTQLQAAINSGVRKLVIPRMETPWIVNPLFLVSDQEIVLEPGTVIEAIRGGFKGRTDHLLSARGKKNIAITGKEAVLCMHKKDYQDANQYTRAEWRHTLAFYSCENVRVEGLTLRSSGGDGIYISSAGKPMDYCKDVIIKDCLLDDHHRQGISVISVENLLVENCTLQNTSGTAPQAGMDFEPNSAGQRLVNVTLRNCTFKDNATSGVIIHTYVREESIPISFKFENCKAINDTFTASFGSGDANGEPLFSKIDITMTNCTETIGGKTRTLNDFWADVMNVQVLTEAQKEILAKVKRVPLKETRLVPMPGVARRTVPAIPTLRGTSYCVAYARKGQTVSFSTSMERESAGMSVTLTAPSGQEKTLAEKMPSGETREIAFQAEESGVYIIKFDLKSGWFSTKVKPESDAGLALAALDRRIHVFTNAGEFYFYVPSGVRDFYVRVAGEGGERVKASLFGPDGALVQTADNISTPHKLIVTRDGQARGEVWKLKTERPSSGPMEDYYIDLIGVPPILATDKASLLAPVE